MPGKEIKWNHMKCSVKNREDRKRGINRANSMKRAFTNMLGINPTTATITLKVNDLTTLLKILNMYAPNNKASKYVKQKLQGK